MVMQRTIRNVVAAEGVGIHLGVMANLRLLPGEPDQGIIFRRVDLPGKPEISASISNVGNTFMCTCLSNQQIKIYTVEHLLAAVAGLGIDNLIVELDCDEIPIMDGSSHCFVFLLQAAGIIQQPGTSKIFMSIKKKVEIKVGDKFVSIEPFRGFKVGFQIEFEHPAFNQDNQFYSVDFRSSSFVKEISRARTFGFLEDINVLRAKKMVLGGSTDNAVVLDQNGVMNQTGLRYKDECVRHKVLDAIGDLSLVGYSVLGSFFGSKSGHALNYQLLKELVSDPSNYELISGDQIPWGLDAEGT